MKKLISLALLVCATASYGQGFGLGKATVIQLTSPVSVASTTAAVTYTNGVFDFHGYDGLALLVFHWTNTVSTVDSPSLGVSLLGCSTASGTFVPLSLAASGVSNAAVNITNIVTGSVGTNTTFSAPTSAFTGAASNSVAGAGGMGTFMFPAGDIPRYLSIRWDVPTGTNTYIVSAELIARSGQQ